jgi:hypothetical protein
MRAELVSKSAMGADLETNPRYVSPEAQCDAT